VEVPATTLAGHPTYVSQVLGQDRERRLASLEAGEHREAAPKF